MSKSKSGRHHQQAIPQARNGAKLKPTKGPFVWETLDQLYAEFAQLCRMPASLAPLITNREAVKRLENPDEVTRIVNGIANDVEAFANQLLAIRQRHQGCVGESTDIDDQVLQLSISEAYLAWKEQFDVVVLPNVLYVQQQFQSIEATAS